MRPKKIILCVDDNEQELSVLKFMLATNGYRVISAVNGQEAIRIFAEIAVDLVLTDFAMPQMNGSQLVDRLKQIASHVPMILLGDPQKMGGEMHGAGPAGADQGDECSQARTAQGVGAGGWAVGACGGFLGIACIRHCMQQALHASAARYSLAVGSFHPLSQNRDRGHPG
jgi:CheY-like chemotaxis protein